MIKIRLGVFETNSSSTHVLVSCPKEIYDKFYHGELYMHKDTRKFFTKEEILKIYNEKNYNLSLEEYINALYDTHEQFSDTDCVFLYREYKNPNEKEMVVFGLYGEDWGFDEKHDDDSYINDDYLYGEYKKYL